MVATKSELTALDDEDETVSDEAGTSPTTADDAPKKPKSKTGGKNKKKAQPEPAPEPAARGITVSPLTLALGALVVVLAVAATAFGFLWLSAKSDRDHARNEIAATAATAEANKRAEDVASKYAIGAATVDYQNLAPWRTALAANTTPQLANTLQSSATELEQIFVPMQWQSTATPLGANVVGNNNGAIQVNVFVNVVTKSTQRPEGIPSVATYAVTVNSNQDWVITDVSGINTALGGK